jgi:hypothetical protein
MGPCMSTENGVSDQCRIVELKIGLKHVSHFSNLITLLQESAIHFSTLNTIKPLNYSNNQYCSQFYRLLELHKSPLLFNTRIIIAAIVYSNVTKNEKCKQLAQLCADAKEPNKCLREKFVQVLNEIYYISLTIIPQVIVDSEPNVIPLKEYTLLRNYNYEDLVKEEVGVLFGKYEEVTHITSEYFVGTLLRKPDFYTPDKIRSLALDEIETK